MVLTDASSEASHTHVTHTLLRERHITRVTCDMWYLSRMPYCLDTISQKMSFLEKGITERYFLTFLIRRCFESSQ